MADVVIIEIPSTPVDVSIPPEAPVCIELGIPGIPGPEGPAGPSGGGNTQTATFTSTAIPGSPVYADGADTVDLADASDSSKTTVVGLADALVAGGSLGDYVSGGAITLSTAEWDAVAGSTGGLTVGDHYLLSDAAPGRILSEVSAAGITAGDSVVTLGSALSTTTLLLEIEKPILRT